MIFHCHRRFFYIVNPSVFMYQNLSLIISMADYFALLFFFLASDVFCNGSHIPFLGAFTYTLTRIAFHYLFFSCPSRLSTCLSWVPTWRIFVKFDITKLLSYSVEKKIQIWLKSTKISDTLREDRSTFYSCRRRKLAIISLSIMQWYLDLE